MNPVLRTLLILTAAGLAPALRAETDPVAVTSVPPESFNLSIGGFLLSNITTKVSLSSSLGGAGTNVDFQQDLKQSSDAQVFRADAEWYFFANHKIEASWFNISQSSTHVLDTTINWGDQVFPVAATIRSHFKTQIYKLNYGYVLSRGETNEFDVLIGFHVSRYEAGLGLAVGGPGTSQNSSVTAPLPVIGLEWKARYTDRLSSKVSVEYFGISLEEGKYSGHLTDFLAVVEYRLTQNWGLSAGFNRFDLTAKLKTDKLQMRVKHDYNGLILSATAHF
jgi:hypothetical protein